MPNPAIIVFAGNHEFALRQAQSQWTASYEPELGTPLYAPCPTFTVLPQLPAAETAIATLRRHHDDVIQPALDSGRSVFCVGAWWREPAIQALTGGFPMEVLATVWPSAARTITVDFEPSSSAAEPVEYLGPDHVRLTPVKVGDLTAALGGSLYELGQLDWPWVASARKRKRK